MDLVPRRRLWQNLIAAAGLAAIGLLLAAHWATHRPEQAVPEAIARTFDATASNSLAGWLRAGMLAAAAGGAMLVYVVRRHRTDDYRGGYRIWLWAAAWMLIMSVDAVASLRDVVRSAGAAEFYWTGPGDGLLWWAMPCLLAAVTVGVRLLLDMRECRTSTVWFGVAAALWVAGEALRLSRTLGAEPLTLALIAAGCSLAGQGCLAMAMSWHARHVVLDASGLLRARKKKKKARQAAETESAAKSGESQTSKRDTIVREETKKPELPRPKVAIPTQPPAAAKPPQSTSSGSSSLAATLTFGGRAAPPPQQQSQQLSKAERKALKREMRRAA